MRADSGGEMEYGVTVCPDCGEQRWAGIGPCANCAARIARADALTSDDGSGA